MILFIEITVGLLILGRLLLWYGAKPYRHKRVYPHRVPSLLRSLLRRGYNGGLLMLELRERRGDERFLQFVKRIDGPGRIALELGFPDAPWSRSVFATVRQKLEAAGFAPTFTGTERSDTTGFLTVDLADDIDAAVRLVEVFMHEVFRVPPTVRMDGLLINVDARDVLIDR